MKIEQDDDAPRYEITANSEARGLSEKQDKFVRQLVIGNTQTEAARLAGYAFPDQDAYRLVRLPKIQREIRDRTEALLNTVGAIVGVGTLLSIAKNEKSPAAARVQAANSLLDRVGIGKKDAPKQSLSDKDISGMDVAALDAFIAGGMAEMERRKLQKDAVDAVIIEGSAQTTPPDGSNT